MRFALEICINIKITFIRIVTTILVKMVLPVGEAMDG